MPKAVAYNVELDLTAAGSTPEVQRLSPALLDVVTSTSADARWYQRWKEAELSGK